MLAATARRSDWPKRQLFIDPPTEADSPLPAQKLPIRVRRVNVRNVVVTGNSALDEDFREPALRSEYEPFAGIS